MSTTTTPLSALTPRITPHLAWPPRLAADGTIGVLDQDTIPEHEQAVALLLSTPLKSLIDNPAFGIPDPTFRNEMPVDELRAAIRRWEPRISQTLVDDGIHNRTATLRSRVGAPNG